MKIKATRTIKVAHPNPCLAKCLLLVEGNDYELDADHGKVCVDLGYATKISIATQVADKVVKKVTKKKKK